jgi:hypothetical protein
MSTNSVRSCLTVYPPTIQPLQQSFKASVARFHIVRLGCYGGKINGATRVLLIGNSALGTRRSKLTSRCLLTSVARSYPVRLGLREAPYALQDLISGTVPRISHASMMDKILQTNAVRCRIVALGWRAILHAGISPRRMISTASMPQSNSLQKSVVRWLTVANFQKTKIVPVGIISSLVPTLPRPNQLSFKAHVARCQSVRLG